VKKPRSDTVGRLVIDEAGSQAIAAPANMATDLIVRLGSALFYSARARAYPALLVVLYVAFIAQYLTKGLLGGYVAALLGAAAAVLAASYIHRNLHGPPFLITFLPAFWLLVPGVLSLVGAARIAVGNVTTQDFAVALFTILAIALGAITGHGIDRTLSGRFRWW
jgi:uncharacterized membrane protein YjjB (DUF3815 family)